jgi:UDP-N-acetylglucosamine:LPS N-acetylglucosamine transferase
MTKKRDLFISGSIGLGHVTRELAIAAELRRQNPGIELYWLAAPPASLVLKNAGEQLLPETDLFANYNVSAEKVAGKYELNPYTTPSLKSSATFMALLAFFARMDRIASR